MRSQCAPPSACCGRASVWSSSRCPRSSARSSTCASRSSTGSRRRARAPSRTGMSSSSPLERWTDGLLATPGLTALRDRESIRRELVEDSLRALELVRALPGRIVDVGSGGGAPGIPLALELPEREVTLLEATGRKCEFLRLHAPPNARVVQGRAEEHGERYGVALAKALAPP